MKKRLSYLLLILIEVASIAAQDRIIVGKVWDKKENTPIPAANIWMKGSPIGTISNNEGFYLLRIPEDTKASTMFVSVIGYKRKEIKLSEMKDEWIDVYLEEEQVFLDEIVVFPGENPALPILKRIRSQKPFNDPQHRLNFESDIYETNDFHFFNIRRKSLQKKLFRNIVNGTVENGDSSLLLPVYHKKEHKILSVSKEGDETETSVQIEENAIEAVGKEQFRNLIENYISDVNFYKNNIVLLGKNFVSPLANFGNVYYQYILIDSMTVNNKKRYVIQFQPKNNKELAFKGEMTIDSLTAALVQINAQIPNSANLNFVDNIALKQNFSPLDTTYHYAGKTEAFAFRLNPMANTSKKGMAAMVKNNATFRNKLKNDSVANIGASMKTLSNDSISFARDSIGAAIDSLNKQKLQHIAAELVNIALHGYVRAWKFDIGPLVNFYRYNKMEGSRLTFGMRTGETMIKNFTLGGFFGYGFKDKRWKYGGEFQSRFGQNYAHTIGLFFQDNVDQYGAQNYYTLNENSVGDVSNLLSSIGWRFKEDHVRKRYAKLMYKYEQRNLNMKLNTKYEQTFGNIYVPFTQNGNPIDQVSVGSVSISSRIGFKQRYIEGFFHRYYLYNQLPIIQIKAEYGHYAVGKQTQGDYVQLLCLLRHKFPLLGGSFRYSFEAGHIMGQVPWTLLDITRKSSSIWISDDRFSLMAPMEFISDTYVYGGFTYFTKGFLFNWIPGIKKLNLREVASFKIAYGGILNPHHAEVLDFPKNQFSSLNKPYMEVSVGIANILKMFAVESVWRVTHRDNPQVANWGVRIRFNVDF